MTTVLHRHYDSLCESLNIDQIMPYLYQKGLITDLDHFEIQSIKEISKRSAVAKILQCTYHYHNIEKFLQIMFEHGTDATRDLAQSIESQLLSSQS